MWARGDYSTSQENPRLYAAVESQVSKTARPGAPGRKGNERLNGELDAKRSPSRESRHGAMTVTVAVLVNTVEPTVYVAVTVTGPRAAVLLTVRTAGLAPFEMVTRLVVSLVVQAAEAVISTGFGCPVTVAAQVKFCVAPCFTLTFCGVMVIFVTPVRTTLTDALPVSV
jgi:hypothetical protein